VVRQVRFPRVSIFSKEFPVREVAAEKEGIVRKAKIEGGKEKTK
jgi:hypothetical protein